MGRDLVGVAAANHARLVHVMADLASTRPHTSVFCAWVEGTAEVLRSLSPSAVDALMESSCVESPFARCERTSADPETAYRDQQGPDWAERRLAFDDAFDGGRYLVYAILSAGKLGCEYYGFYTAKIPITDEHHVAVSPGNTLLSFTSPDGVVLVDDLEKAVGPYCDRGIVSVVRLGDRVPIEPEDWEVALFDPEGGGSADSEFTEVILPEAIPAEALELRLPRERYRQLLAMALVSEEGQDWAAEIEQLRRVIDFLSALGKPLVRVP